MLSKILLVKDLIMKKLISILFLGMMAMSLIACASVSTTEYEKIKDQSPNGLSTAQKDIVEEENSVLLDVLSNDDLYSDFLNACENIGLNTSEIKVFHQVDDWASGPRYSFVYMNLSLRLYCNMDSTVNSIKNGVDTDIYKQGYEPYEISDYIVDSSVSSALKGEAEDLVTAQLNYPSTADFSWLNWNIERNNDLYTLSNSLTAENAFGVEDKMTFNLAYQVTDDNYELVYFTLGGIELKNNIPQIIPTERKKIAQENTDVIADNSTINLVYGELGDYGQTINLDGEDYIHFHVPSGSYTVTNNGKFCTIYLANDEYFKNAYGYMENEIFETLEFKEYNQSKPLTVSDSMHLELTINANITLTPTN